MQHGVVELTVGQWMPALVIITGGTVYGNTGKRSLSSGVFHRGVTRRDAK